MDHEIVEAICVEIRHDRPSRRGHSLPDGCGGEARTLLAGRPEEDSDLAFREPEQQITLPVAVPVAIDRREEPFEPSLLEIEPDGDRLGPCAREAREARALDAIDTQLDLRALRREHPKDLHDAELDAGLNDLVSAITVEVDGIEHGKAGLRPEASVRRRLDIGAAARVAMNLEPMLASHQRSEGSMEEDVREAIAVEVTCENADSRRPAPHLLFGRERVKSHRPRRPCRESTALGAEYVDPVAREREQITSIAGDVATAHEGRPRELREERGPPRRSGLETFVVGPRRRREAPHTARAKAHQTSTVRGRKQDRRLAGVGPVTGGPEQRQAVRSRWKRQWRIENDAAGEPRSGHRDDFDACGRDEDEIVARRGIDVCDVDGNDIGTDRDRTLRFDETTLPGSQHRHRADLVRRCAACGDDAETSLATAQTERRNPDRAAFDAQCAHLERIRLFRSPSRSRTHHDDDAGNEDRGRASALGDRHEARVVRPPRHVRYPSAMTDPTSPTAFDPHAATGNPFAPYVLAPTAPAPAGIPTEPVAPIHAEHAAASTLAERRAELLAHILRSPAPPHVSAIFHEIGRLAAGGPAHTGIFEAALAYVDARLDCADFVLHGVLRLVLQFGDDLRVSRALVEHAHRSLLGFKYWPDEPGRDSMCTWTENHQILFASAALIAGQMHPDAVFSNSGETGLRKQEIARRRILRWLDLRFRTGFSEWLSNVYYDEDLVALLTLVDFAQDDEIRRRAEMVTDLLLLDLALHGFRGVFASTHGRSYESSKKWAAEESTTDTSRLLFGAGSFARRENMAAVCLALSRYRSPLVLRAIATDTSAEPLVVRQRMGLRLDELKRRWRLDPLDPEDMMVLLSLEAYAHPATIEGFVRLLDRFGWWDNEFFRPFARVRPLIARLRRLGLLRTVFRLLEADAARNVRPEVNVLTYRTPDGQLSSALDWRAGKGGDQQHVWQATLGPDAVCFTTHPGSRRARSPGHWTGSATLPRVGQIENLLVAIYSIPRRPFLLYPNRNLYTHAWLPRDRFDEVVERGGWFFARRGDGFLALRSQRPARWSDATGEDAGREIVAPGRDNVWVCELGRRATSGSFDEFVDRIAHAPITFGRRRVAYRSPSQGRISFGWRGPLLREGRPVPLAGFSRYDTPYGAADFPSDVVTLAHGGHALRLRWADASREASGFLA